MNTDHDWTTDAVARLRTLWAEGQTTAEIGRRMGLTKNAVIGKVHRLQLPKRLNPICRTPGGPRNPAPARVRRPILAPLASIASSVPPPPPPQRQAALPAPTRSYAGRSDRPCCWPLGEPGQPGFRFCDAATTSSRPYCPEHADVAYVRPAAARDRPDGARLTRYLRTLTQTA